jgi:hypothetical protein
MLNLLIFLFCLPIFCLRAIPAEEKMENFTTGPAPACAKSCDYDAEALFAIDSDAKTVCLRLASN